MEKKKNKVSKKELLITIGALLFAAIVGITVGKILYEAMNGAIK